MKTWRLWCPICERYRNTRIPAEASTAVVTRAYDEHMKKHGKNRSER